MIEKASIHAGLDGVWTTVKLADGGSGNVNGEVVKAMTQRTKYL